MNIRKFTAGLLAALCLISALCPAALAAPAEDDGSWDKIIADFLDKYEDRNKSCSMTLGYRNLVTGEEHFYRGGEYMMACDMYKVPLNMYFTEKVYNGEMDEDTEIGGVKYSDILEETIVDAVSSRSSELLVSEIGSYNDYRRAISQYVGVDPDKAADKYYENTISGNNFFTAEQMIFCLRTLYENQERFPGLIDLMLEAEPERFFNYHEQEYDVAHKFGYMGDPANGIRYQNDCAIVYTDEPIAIVIFTDNTPDSDNALADYCTLMADYAQGRLDASSESAAAPSASPSAVSTTAGSIPSSPTPAPTPVPTNSPTYATGIKVAKFALQYVGYNYLYGGKDPETGFDCSGLVYYTYGCFGYQLDRTAAAQAQNGEHVELDALEPGDILCFYNGGSWIGHVGIYIGGGEYVHAQNEATGVIISAVSDVKCKIEARRILIPGAEL